MSVLRLTLCAYGVAAAALPCAASLAQPTNCFWYLYVPGHVALCWLLCAAAGAAQWFSVLPDKLRIGTAALFALAIQATVLVPCVSDEAESDRVLHRAAETLVAGVLAASTILITVVGLLRRARLGAFIAAVGLGVAAVVLVLGVARQYMGIAGVGIWATAPFAELSVPTLLVLTSSATLVGTAVAGFRREQVSRMHRGAKAA